jgi:hypothetical protein
MKQRAWSWGLTLMVAACGTNPDAGTMSSTAGGGGMPGSAGSIASGGSGGSGPASGGTGGIVLGGAGKAGQATVDTCPDIAGIQDPEVVSDKMPFMYRLIAEGDALYFVDSGKKIQRWKPGMAAPEVVANGPAEEPLAVVGTKLYYGAAMGEVYAASLDALPAEGTQVAGATYSPNYSTLRAHDDTALFTADIKTGIIRRMPFDGSAGMDLATAMRPQRLRVVGDWLYYTNYLGFYDGFRRVHTSGGGDEVATAGVTELYTDFDTDGKVLWMAEQNRITPAPIGGTEKRPMPVSEATGPTYGSWFDNLSMVGDVLYLEHTKGGCARVTSDGKCNIISRKFDGDSYAILGDYVYYQPFGMSGNLYRFKR